jgi:hypothetical protein
MYTNPMTPIFSSDKTINTEDSIKSIQGPCGNTLFQSLSLTNDYHGTASIPRINDEQLIIEERYSIIDGCFGTVKINYFNKIFFIFKNKIDRSRLYLSSSSI